VPVGDDDEDFLALLDAYLDEPHDPNPAMASIHVLWVEDDPGVGALHIAQHDVTKAEVEQVLFEIPPVVQAKRSRQHPERTLFWGATRQDRWIFIVCEDWIEDGVRYLKRSPRSNLTKANNTGGLDEQEEGHARGRT
jgi:hypothetical protein